MATAVGDLVASLRLDNAQFAQSINESARMAGEKGGEIEAHTGGASRAFRFLGKEAREAGEAMGGSFGETISGLGGVTSGIGEAVHGYHALHTAIEVATAAQASLNAISPIGWSIMISGAAAATASYLLMKESIKQNEHEVTHLAEAQENLERVTSQRNEAMTYGLIAGPAGAGLAWLAYKGAVDDAAASVEKIKTAATTAAAAEIHHLHDELSKLTETPLELFQEKLADTGKSYIEVARLTNEFRNLTAEIERAKDQTAALAELRTWDFQQSTNGMTEGQAHLAKWREEHPHADFGEDAMAVGLATALDARNQHTKDHAEAEKVTAEIMREQLDHAQKLREEVEGLTAGPLDKQVKQINEIRKGVEMGIIGAGQGAAAEAKIQAELKDKMAAEQNQPAQQPQALEKESDSAWKAILTAMQGGDKKDEHAAKTAENTARIAALLQAIKDKPTGVIEFN